jgi:taurine dioxygenase
MSYQFYSQREPTNFKHFTVTPVSGSLGGLIEGLDLTTNLSDEAFNELNSAFLEFKVLFFRKQPMTPAQHLAFAKRFGMPQGPGTIPQVDGYPMIRRQQQDEYSSVGSDVNYHADDSFRDYPSKMSILRGLDVPPGGGNTIFCDMEKAFDTLSEPMKVFLEGLTCEHNLDKTFGRGILDGGGGKAWEDMMKRNPPAIHPLVVRHPETGRKCLYANEMASVRILELSQQESDTLLEMLFKHSYSPEFECRFYWENDSIAMWDNRCLQHRGINDFSPAFRFMHRIPIITTRRPSLNPDQEPELEIDYSQPYIKTDVLFDVKPELSYDDSQDDTRAAIYNQMSDSSNSDVAEVDPKFLASLNEKKAGIVFTSGAAAQLKKIPALFRGPALRSIFQAAEAKGVSEVNMTLLAEVNEKRKAS